MNRVSIQAACESETVFEQSFAFQPAGTASIGERLRASGHAAEFGPATRTATIRSYRLRQPILDAATQRVFRGRDLIAETDDPAFDTEFPDSKDVVRVPERVVFCVTWRWTSYYHWLAQCLPAIDWSMRHPDRSPDLCLALPQIADWQEQTLNLLGHGETPRVLIEPSRLYQPEVGAYSGFLFNETPFFISLSVTETLRRLARATPMAAVTHELVYVYSHDQYYGTLDNQSDLVEFLRARGFHILVPDLSNPVEQIQVFKAARIIIAPHGQALANIGFCRPGTLIWELFAEGYINVCFNRLAQSAGLTYWADLFASTMKADGRHWSVDLSVMDERLGGIEAHLRSVPHGEAGEAALSHSTGAQTPFETSGYAQFSSLPLGELMLKFETIGEDCEFGLVQREAGVEPLGLFRFNGFYLPWEQRLDALLSAMDQEFEGLGAPGSINLVLEPDPNASREYMVRESTYNLLYHTFKNEGEIEPDDLKKEQSLVLQFLRRKFLADLQTGEKIWIFRQRMSYPTRAIMRLMTSLRSRGPNRLLWIAHAEDAHPPGLILRLEPDLIKGFITPPIDSYPGNFAAGPWHEVCRKAYAAFAAETG